VRIKILVGTWAILSVFFLFKMVFSGIVLKEYSINNNVEKSELLAEIVKMDLTNLMFSNSMDKRGEYLNRLTRLKKVNSARIVRGDIVSKDFGEGLLREKFRSPTDLKSIKNKKTEFILNEDNILEVSVPYFASSLGTHNCMSCHVSAKEGDILGLISLKIDLNLSEKRDLETLAKFSLLNIIFLFIAMILIYYFINPYFKISSQLIEAFKKAQKGDFSSRIKTSLKGEGLILSNNFNTLFDSIEKTLKELSKGFKVYLNKENLSSNVLEESSLVLEKMNLVQSFRKIIETDQSAHDIYLRIINIMEHKLGLKNFVFYEMNLNSKNIKEFYSVGINNKNNICLGNIGSLDQMPSQCRSLIHNQVIISDINKKICLNCSFDKFENIPKEQLEHNCIPFSIDNDNGLFIIIYGDKGFDCKEKKGLLMDILNSAKSTIKGSILLNKLEESSYKDALTGLFNRRYLDNTIKSSISINARYTVALIDIDFFKSINDTYGHDNGDIIIKKLSTLLVPLVGNRGKSIRYGGEEFLIYFPNMTEEAVFKLLIEFKDKFSKINFNFKGDTVNKTITVGVASNEDMKEISNITSVIKESDKALYFGKNNGRNQVVKASSLIKQKNKQILTERRGKDNGK